MRLWLKFFKYGRLIVASQITIRDMLLDATRPLDPPEALEEGDDDLYAEENDEEVFMPETKDREIVLHVPLGPENLSRAAKKALIEEHEKEKALRSTNLSPPRERHCHWLHRWE